MELTDSTAISSSRHCACAASSIFWRENFNGVAAHSVYAEWTSLVNSLMRWIALHIVERTSLADKISAGMPSSTLYVTLATTPPRLKSSEWSAQSGTHTIIIHIRIIFQSVWSGLNRSVSIEKEVYKSAGRSGQVADLCG